MSLSSRSGCGSNTGQSNLCEEDTTANGDRTCTPSKNPMSPVYSPDDSSSDSSDASSAKACTITKRERTNAGSDSSSSASSSSSSSSSSDEDIKRAPNDQVFKGSENNALKGLDFQLDDSTDDSDGEDDDDDKGSLELALQTTRTTFEDPPAGLFDDTSDDDDKGKMRVRQLPMLASKYLSSLHGLVEFGWTPTLKTMLTATRSHGGVSASMTLLRDHEDTLIRRIYEYLSFPKLANHVKRTVPADQIIHGQSEYEVYDYDYDYGDEDDEPAATTAHQSRSTSDNRETIQRRQSLLRGLPQVSDGYRAGYVAHASLGQVALFPEPMGRSVNMMPFTLGDVDSLPDDLKCYYPLIERCPNEKRSGVAYLTVEESYVEVGATQRRPGLHIETPGIFGCTSHEAACRPGRERYWGMGYFVGADQFLGGIYFASTTDSSCRVFDALVDKTVPAISDRHGGCEHLRSVIGDGKMLGANELVWMTDLTPHEALPQQESGYRQFFRLVMPEISHWFAKHSTPNPKVPLPDGIIVVDESKFESAS
mmetsp:Transcript_12353/g.19483  ORF Transcript_12353/g.19483 Transcript_12353/m.19483 type:complete len:537 (-) Transcript_12353:61-1671(-)